MYQFQPLLLIELDAYVVHPELHDGQNVLCQLFHRSVPALLEVVDVHHKANHLFFEVFTHLLEVLVRSEESPDHQRRQLLGDAVKVRHEPIGELQHTFLGLQHGPHGRGQSRLLKAIRQESVLDDRENTVRRRVQIPEGVQNDEIEHNVVEGHGLDVPGFQLQLDVLPVVLVLEELQHGFVRHEEVFRVLVAQAEQVGQHLAAGVRDPAAVLWILLVMGDVKRKANRNYSSQSLP